MCGIWCCISRLSGHSVESCKVYLGDASAGTLCSPCASVSHGESPNDPVAVVNFQRELISRRGPDATHIYCCGLTDELQIHLESHVLWTQGERTYQQPFTNSEGNKLMIYNGDIYSFSGPEVQDSIHDGCHTSNDGYRLFRLLEQNYCDEAAICRLLGKLQGPFAFIFLDKESKCLWFTRDFFGKESLLFSYETCPSCDTVLSWNISSVSVYKNVLEIPASSAFCINLKTFSLKRFPYSHYRKNVVESEIEFLTALKNSGLIAEVSDPSNNIDLNFNCSLKSLESNEVASQNDILVSLINEAIGNGNVSSEEFLRGSLQPLSAYIEQFLTCLRKSVKRRVSVLPPYCKNCLILHNNQNNSEFISEVICEHAKVGVLFSGGLDSTVLAYLAAEVLPTGSTLDLINVAFSKNDNFSNIPDRETALASYKMLKERFSSKGKKINLVLVNVSKPEVEEERHKRVKYLILPLKSVLDDSVGVCLWFAARGKGYLHAEDGGAMNSYTSPIRVVLLGSGADELLGGYGRHRSAYEKSGWLGLAAEMQLEIDRISIRNLGRDNRIVSDHGICPRMPFLDENVVDFLASRCDLWVKCCPVNVGPLGSRGSGEKLVLRAVAAKLFGDPYLSLALFPKRAMQFGSRIAKLENSKEKGGDSCQRLH